MSKLSIYGLADPLSPLDIRYVGKTVMPVRKRVYAHCALSNTYHGAADAWLLALQFNLRMPVIYVLGEYQCEGLWNERTIEELHINHHRDRLLNASVWRKRVKLAGVPDRVIDGYTSAFFGVAQSLLASEGWGYEIDRIPRHWSTVAAIESAYPALTLMKDTFPRTSVKSLTKAWLEGRLEFTEKSLAISQHPNPEALLSIESAHV